MNNLPLVSVIMPVRNGASYISESIRSVQEQTCSDWELIIVDDGSSDDTELVVAGYRQQDKRIRYYFQDYGGQGKARNMGISLAMGNLIALLDADDIWFPEKLQQQVKLIKHTGADLVFADIITIDATGKRQSDTYGVTDGVFSGNSAVANFFKKNSIPALTVLAKRDAVLMAGGFDVTGETQYGEDYCLWIRMLLNQSRFVSSRQQLGAYRLHQHQATGNKKGLIDILNMLHNLSIEDRELARKKNAAMQVWILRFIRLNPIIDTPAWNNLLLVYPYAAGRKLFQIITAVAGVNTAILFMRVSCAYGIRI